MFFTFLNKENPDYLDSSLLLNALPRQVLYYFYQGAVRISQDVLLTLQQVACDNSSLSDNARVWINLVEEQLEAEGDLEIFINNPYLKTIGPYYYPDTNTRFYFTKHQPDPNRLFTGYDLSLLKNLDKAVPLHPELNQYLKSKKTKKSSVPDLLRDLEMSKLALQEIEHLKRHMNYLRQMLDQRYYVVEQEELFPLEPDEIPEKPIRETEERLLDNIIPFSKVRSLKKKSDQDSSRFNHDVKVYFIRYREYEKACERYKQVLSNWSMYHQAFLDRCYDDIDEMEVKLKKATHNLDLYNSLLSKSIVHSDYQDTRTLSMFSYFLETGRAHDIQECMNLYEEEKHWGEVKASQERIENTIYFLQNSTEQGLVANEQLDILFKRRSETELVLASESTRL